MIEGLDDCSSINPIYPRVEETIKKRNKRQRVGTFENFIYTYKQVVDLNTPIKEIAFGYHLLEI